MVFSSWEVILAISRESRTERKSKQSISSEDANLPGLILLSVDALNKELKRFYINYARWFEKRSANLI